MSRVLIIIPAYNAERTIRQCLEAIFVQTYRDFEVVVVNDGSTDNTLAVVDDTISRLRNREIFLKVITQKNQGAQVARNRGWQELAQSTIHDTRYTRYTIFCDADIVLQKDCIEKMVSALEKHPEASYAYTSFKFGWKIFKLWSFDAERLQKMPYIHTTSLIRYSALKDLLSDDIIYLRSQINDVQTARDIVRGPFDQSIKRLQDWDLWLTMLGQGHTGVWVPEILFQVISTQGTMSKWLPSFVYKLPFMESVKKYNEAVNIIKQKHKILQY